MHLSQRAMITLGKTLKGFGQHGCDSCHTHAQHTQGHSPSLQLIHLDQLKRAHKTRREQTDRRTLTLMDQHFLFAYQITHLMSEGTVCTPVWHWTKQRN